MRCTPRRCRNATRCCCSCGRTSRHTSRAAIAQPLADGHDLVLEIDWQGALQIRRQFPQAVLVFILPPGWDELRERIRRRGRALERRIEADYLRAVADAYGEHFDAQPELPLLMVDIDRFDPLRRPADLQALIDRLSKFEGPRESLLSPPTIAG